MKKKQKNIESIVDKNYSQDETDTMSGLCIKHNRPTNYSYNKSNINYPYCKSSLTCVYKEHQEDGYHCRYFLEKTK